jgi:serine/threonine protein kinase
LGNFSNIFLRYDSKINLQILIRVNKGKLPFEGDTIDEIREKNLKCSIDFGSINISQSGLQLLKCMLLKSPKNRISVKEALFHQWFFEEKY